MYKFFAFFATLILTVKAEEYVAEVSIAKFVETPSTENIIKVEKGEDQSEFTWLMDVDTDTQISVQLQIVQDVNGEDIMQEITLENICDEYDDPAKKILQEILLMKLAGVDSCPIKEGSNAGFKYISSIPFSKESATCGRFVTNLQIFMASSIFLEAISAGNVTGSSCQQ